MNIETRETKNWPDRDNKSNDYYCILPNHMVINF